MSDLLPVIMTVCRFLLTYLLHSTCLILMVALVVQRLKNPKYLELRVLAWKLALILPVMTTLLFSSVELPHWGYEFALFETDTVETEKHEVG